MPLQEGQLGGKGRILDRQCLQNLRVILINAGERGNRLQIIDLDPLVLDAAQLL